MGPNWRILKVLGEGLEIIIGLMTMKQWFIFLISLGLLVSLFIPIIVRGLQ